MPDDFIYSTDDVSRMLDQLLDFQDGARWDRFFADRAKPVPFFVDRPDENLVEWCQRGRITSGRVLELGCGHGRNAVFLAQRGCTVDAIDLSAEALKWAAELASRAHVDVNFHHASIIESSIDEAAFDVVYDSGCFHHLAPHRRRDYVDLVGRALKPGGSYGLVCFKPQGGSGFTDQQVYERRHLGGGLGYTEERLRAVWDRIPFHIIDLRPMRKTTESDDRFGEDFLQVLLATKRVAV